MKVARGRVFHGEKILKRRSSIIWLGLMLQRHALTKEQQRKPGSCARHLLGPTDRPDTVILLDITVLTYTGSAVGDVTSL
jgi:hypothetical protein